MVAVSTISPQQILQFNQQRSNARQQNLASQSQAQFRRQLQDVDFQNQLLQFNTTQNRAREALPTEFSQRGILNSGIYRRALQRFATDRLQGFNNLNLANQRALGEISLGARGSEAELFRQLSQSFGAEQAARADIASQLRGFL